MTTTNLDQQIATLAAGIDAADVIASEAKRIAYEVLVAGEFEELATSEELATLDSSDRAAAEKLLGRDMTQAEVVTLQASVRAHLRGGAKRGDAVSAASATATAAPSIGRVARIATPRRSGTTTPRTTIRADWTDRQTEETTMTIQKTIKRRRSAELKALNAWRAPIGSAVDVTADDGSKVRRVTESMPWALGDGTPVIKVSGIVGCYLLTRVRAIAEPTPRD